MYPPPDLSREKRGMVWVGIKVLQKNMTKVLNAGENLNELRPEVE
jgi:hypothetical protein